MHCVSIEHKLGIHASPTCVLAFGDHGGAIGHPDRRAEPRPRIHVHHDERGALRGRNGRPGAVRARLPARAAVRQDRIQGTEPASVAVRKSNIIHHPDVRRMLMNMKSQTEAMRALAYVVGLPPTSRTSSSGRVGSRAEPGLRGSDDSGRQGWCTENSIEIASTGVQVHGGMGFIEETGCPAST